MLRHHPLCLVAFVLLFHSHAIAEETRYAKPELLVEPSQLPALPEATVLIDVRSREEYRKGHLPGAVHVDLSEWKSGFGEGDDAGAWSLRIGGLGIDNETTVVVYDQALTGSAARAWWILKYWSVRDARILNGGWQAMQAVEVEPETDIALVNEAEFKAQADPTRIATFGSVMGELYRDGKSTCLLDTRSPAEHQGGTIPGSEHLNWTSLVVPETGKLRSATELKQLLANIDYREDATVITFCQSGGRASVMAFALELMGAKKVQNYYGSWGQWSKQADAPVEQPNSKTVEQ